MNFAQIAFTEAVQKLQAQAGSRDSYARMEARSSVDGLTAYEEDFIAHRDHFYMASIGENGFPYIQHRGGPKGFLKVLDEKRLGFVDFRGNMQFISVGNLATHNKVAVILMDYPAKARLKIYAEAEVVELAAQPSLFAMLDLADYKAKPERMIVLHVKAYDWNCPQHITPRFTLEEIEVAFASQRQLIEQLQAENMRLKSQLAALKP
jgi:uncharacterized protein